MNKYKYLDNRSVIISVDAQPGTAQEMCLRDALMLAIEEGVIVKVTHDGKTFSIDPEEHLSNIKLNCA